MGVFVAQKRHRNSQLSLRIAAILGIHPDDVRVASVITTLVQMSGDCLSQPKKEFSTFLSSYVDKTYTANPNSTIVQRARQLLAAGDLDNLADFIIKYRVIAHLTFDINYESTLSEELKWSYIRMDPASYSFAPKVLTFSGLAHYLDTHYPGYTAIATIAQSMHPDQENIDESYQRYQLVQGWLETRHSQLTIDSALAIPHDVLTPN